MKILFAGGGTGGPTAPLIAVAHAVRQVKPDAHVLLVGTASGPERAMSDAAGIPFRAVSGGKLHRYFTVRNFAVPFLVMIGFFQALRIVRQFRPGAAMGAGSFAQVPVLYACWLMRVPVLIHQQDVQPGLANMLCAPIARRITVTFERSVRDFPQGLGLFDHGRNNKVVLTGNPFRSGLRQGSKKNALARFSLSPDWPTLLIMGGGTGATFVNALVYRTLPALLNMAQVIHITGRNKAAISPINHSRYHSAEFIHDMDLAYAAADIVVSRAGLSTITELAILGKISIIIPMPNSHQLHNAGLLERRKAALVLNQDELPDAEFAQVIRALMFDRDLQDMLKKNIAGIMPHDAAERIAALLIHMLRHA